jgi:hypothetical protein
MEDKSLYKAACEAAVSQSTADSCFSKMVVAACLHTTADSFKEECKEVEKQVLKDLEITSMPNPWRSAKSVCCTALSMNISFYDENGVPKGKTKLQTEIKSKKEESKEEKTIYMKFEEQVKALSTLYFKLSDSEPSTGRYLIKGLMGEI